MTCTSGLPGFTGAGSTCPVLRSRPESRSASRSARRSSIYRGSLASRPRARRVSHSNEATASGAGSNARSDAIPSSSALTATRRPVWALSCRCSAPSGSTAMIARSNAPVAVRRSVRARGATPAPRRRRRARGEVDDGVADRGDASLIDPALFPHGEGVEQPGGHASAWRVRTAAVPVDRCSAVAISSAAQSVTEPGSVRRYSERGDQRACRACAHAARRSNPTMASTRAGS